MTAAYLSKVGNDLVNRCGTRDPFRIAHELGIEVLFCEDLRSRCDQAIPESASSEHHLPKVTRHNYALTV